MSLECCNPIEMFYNHIELKYQINYNPRTCNINPILVPCSKCPACQEKYKINLGLRAMHEAMYYNDCMFITLTVNKYWIDEIFPNGSLNHRPFQLFMKRFRKMLDKEGIKIKYLMCGEYGAENNRPHFHAIIYGYKFKDLTNWKNHGTLKRSATLEKLWRYGFSTVGTVTHGSCKYLAKYVAKSKEKTLEDYTCPKTGLIRKKEYMVYPSGKNGGLGFRFFEENRKEFFKRGYFQLKSKRGREGGKLGIPRYYKRKLKELYPEEFEEYMKMANKIIQEANKKYIDKNFLEEPSLRQIRTCSEFLDITIDEAREYIMKERRKTISSTDVYYLKLYEGSVRRKIIERKRVQEDAKQTNFNH